MAAATMTTGRATTIDQRAGGPRGYPQVASARSAKAR